MSILYIFIISFSENCHENVMYVYERWIILAHLLLKKIIIMFILIKLIFCSYLYLQYDDGLHGYMDSGAAAMYDPHSGHRPPGLPGIPPHHSPHMSHAAAASVGMHGYHGTSSHVSPATNHMGAVQPDVHKRDKEAIYG